MYIKEGTQLVDVCVFICCHALGLPRGIVGTYGDRTSGVQSELVRWRSNGDWTRGVQSELDRWRSTGITGHG